MTRNVGALTSEFSPMQGDLSAELARDELLRLRDQTDLGTSVHDARSERYLHDSYGTVAMLAHVALLEVDPSGASATLLSEAYKDAKPRKLHFASLPEGMVAEYAAHTQELRIDKDIVETVSKPLINGKFTFRDPRDKQLVGVMAGMAHEAGHSFLDGIGLQLAPDAEWELRRATKTYLQNHPETAVSGNWMTDYAVHEERTAEGFGNMVTRKALETLGYDGAQRDEFLRILKFRPLVEDGLGQNQIDYLHKVGPQLALHEMVGGEGDLAQRYDGILGYSRPLENTELAAMFAELSQLKENGVPFREKPSAWFRRVQTVRALGRSQVQGFVNDLEAARARGLGRVVGEDVAVSAAASRELHPGVDMFVPDHTQVFVPVG